MTPFVNLHAHSAFSFLDSSASAQDLVLRAAELGQPALALTDLHSVTGVPSFVKACGKAGIKPIGGCTVRIDGGEMVLLADGPMGWSSLCKILTVAALRDVKRQELSVTWDDIENDHAGLVCLSGSFGRGRLAALLHLAATSRLSNTQNDARPSSASATSMSKSPVLWSSASAKCLAV